MTRGSGSRNPTSKRIPEYVAFSKSAEERQNAGILSLLGFPANSAMRTAKAVPEDRVGACTKIGHLGSTHTGGLPVNSPVD